MEFLTAPNKLRLVAQHRQIGRSPHAVGGHHREVHRDPARIMPTTPLPYRTRRITDRSVSPVASVTGAEADPPRTMSGR